MHGGTLCKALQWGTSSSFMHVLTSETPSHLSILYSIQGATTRQRCMWNRSWRNLWVKIVLKFIFFEMNRHNQETDLWYKVWAFIQDSTFRNLSGPSSGFFIFIYLYLYTGLVQLEFAGLPLRSCLDHWVTFCGTGVILTSICIAAAQRLEPMQAQS